MKNLLILACLLVALGCSNSGSAPVVARSLPDGLHELGPIECNAFLSIVDESKGIQINENLRQIIAELGQPSQVNLLAPKEPWKVSATSKMWNLKYLPQSRCFQNKVKSDVALISIWLDFEALKVVDAWYEDRDGKKVGVLGADLK